MAEGQTPSPEIKQGTGADSLPWGEAAQVNDLIGLAPPPTDPADEFKPSGPEQEFLYSQTDRPQEPFSAGLPFGAGPGSTPHANETDDQFVQRVAQEVKADPRAPKQLRQFADRALNGM